MPAKIFASEKFIEIVSGCLTNNPTRPNRGAGGAFHVEICCWFNHYTLNPLNIAHNNNIVPAHNIAPTHIDSNKPLIIIQHHYKYKGDSNNAHT